MDIFQKINTFRDLQSKQTATAKREQWLESLGRSQDLSLKAFVESFLQQKQKEKFIDIIFENSPFLTQGILKYTSVLKQIYEQGADAAFSEIIGSISGKYKKYDGFDDIMSNLRIAKSKASLLIAITDILDIWPLEKITKSLSILAEVSVNEAVNFLLYRAARFNEIKIDENNPGINSGLTIIAMGKLGAYELNYSSDIDIVFFFDSEKVQYTGENNAQYFFNRLVQDFTRIMHDRTRDGYVFRIDLRLRPDPASTPPAMSVRAAEIYYESVGQNWERAAMIKARPVAGDIETGKRFLDYLRPYVWRKNLDFAAIEDIQSIKRQIDNKHSNSSQELYNYNIKLGHGGIREIEFFVQTQQLIWGGREPELRKQATCDAMKILAKIEKIPPSTCDEMISAYHYYRKIEHRLQMISDHQTHSLPANEHDLEKFSLFFGSPSVQEFKKELSSTLAMVQKHYSDLFNTSPSLASVSTEAQGSLVFTGTENDPETLETIKKLGFKDPTIISETIRGWHHGRRKVTRTKRARELITELTPAILSSFSKTVNPDAAFAKFDEFLTRLPDGLQIFSLFYSNPHLLELIAEIMGRYEYLADRLCRKPALLDYVLSPEFYLNIPDREELKEKLEINLAQARDLQDVLDITRRWTQDRQFRAGVQLLKNKISSEEASLHLSNIADSVLTTLFKEIEKDFSEKHGRVPGSSFSIIAMGKLGGKELTFNSDLDLVFVYDVEESSSTMSDGKTPLTVNEYFLRLSRRFITAITSLTPEGKLYEIDIRLRPSGNDGPIAASLKAFDHYYESSAWIWEFMALTRARIITGSDGLNVKLKETIIEKLRKRRDKAELSKAIREMREKIDSEHSTKNHLDIKYVRGGLIDLEFIIQYLQLLNASDFPDIIDGNIHSALDKIDHFGLISKEQNKILKKAAIFLLKTQSIIRLIANITPKEETITKGMRIALSNILNDSDIEGLHYEEFKKTLVNHEQNVHKCFEEIIGGGSL